MGKARQEHSRQSDAGAREPVSLHSEATGAGEPVEQRQAGTVLQPTALDLAQLAATLNPSGCCGANVEKVLREAALLHIHARLFLEKNQGLSLDHFKASDAELLAHFRQFYDAKQQEKLRLYERPIKAEPDDACRYVGWKHPRRVKEAVRALFIYRAQRADKSQEEGEEEFARFWSNSKNDDEKGRPYVALHPEILDRAKSVRAEQYRRRSLHGAATKRKHGGTQEQKVSPASKNKPSRNPSIGKRR